LNENIKYAGFFTRFAAKIIDILILSFPLNIIESTFGDESTITLISIALIWWLYDSFMISSSWGATFGKKILGIKIFDDQMQQLAFTKATIRFIYSILSYTFILPFFMMFFTQKRQTFHDYFAKTIAIDTFYTHIKEVVSESVRNKEAKIKSNDKKSLLRKLIITIVFIILLMPLIYFGIFISSMFSAHSSEDKVHDNSHNNKVTKHDKNLITDATVGSSLYQEIDWLRIFKAKEDTNTEEDTHISKAVLEEGKKLLDKAKALSDKNLKDAFDKAIKEKKKTLHAAIWYKQNIVLDTLIANHIDLNEKDRFGRTPLFIAVQKENVYAVEQLLKNGADMYIMDKSNTYTAFTWLMAEQNVNMAIVKLFLDNGIDVNFQHEKSGTALTVATKGCKKFKLVKLLLDSKADPELMDEFGHNTKTGLSRYCRDKKAYAKMIKMIEDETSFFHW